MSRGAAPPEVLAPAGGHPQLRAAIESGADAVYFGTLGQRSKVSRETIRRAILTARSIGVAVIDRTQIGFRPGFQCLRQLSMPVFKKRPVEETPVRH